MRGIELDPAKTAKAMVETKYQQEKEKTKVEVQKVPAARKLVGYFRSSTTVKEKLDLVQEHMGKPKKKLIQEVETRWYSSFQMLERLVELREPVSTGRLTNWYSCADL
ncbi:zinc finger BED domain-containing protein 4-like isoform X3 [Electrophorus electricus]|uniref:zinc finger BED domain-containing protein 4-like isoform X3 n=1 Tax=Electrophorus electricus TaxID=8005 RepID=UPI0015CF8F95|nr:zinc finger BED domain-containing protein 4-like isoform X3 [Electrophorus electricus]